jgi:hypothetical protein
LVSATIVSGSALGEAVAGRGGFGEADLAGFSDAGPAGADDAAASGSSLGTGFTAAARGGPPARLLAGEGSFAVDAAGSESRLRGLSVVAPEAFMRVPRRHRDSEASA